MLSLDRVRRLKEVLRATSAPLAFDGFHDFAEAVLNPLIELTRSRGGNLYITDVTASRKPIFLWHSYDAGFVIDYQEGFYKESPIRLLLPKDVHVGQSCQVVDYDQFRKTAFYGEFLAPRRIHHLAALVARIPEAGTLAKTVGVVGLQKKTGDEAFSEEDLEVLEILENPVKGALHTLLLAGNEKKQLEQAFDAMPVGVLVLDWKLTAVYRNPALVAALAEHELTLAEWESLRALATRIRGSFLTRARDDEPESVETTSVHRGRRRLDLRATVLPEGILGARPHILCLFEETSPRFTRPDEESLRSSFGLTAREAEIVSRCLLGETNPQIASALHISAETVKHHLKSVFQKTNVKRRSQLATVFSSS